MSNVSSSNSHKEYLPKLRFKGFKDSWSTATLGELGTFTKGAPLSKADISNEGTPFILYGELYTTYKEIATDIVRKTSKTADSVCLSHIGDVIIPTSGETPEEIATATCVMLPDVILAGDLNIYRNNAVDGRVISYIINHVINGDISRIAQGKSVVHIKADELAKIAIHYPSAVEQQKLIAFLQRIDKQIELQSILTYTIKSYKRGLQQAVFREISHNIKLKDCVLFEPKSTIAAGDSCDDGKYILYRSGQKDGRTNDCTHNGVYIIANDGGEAKFKLTNGAFAYTDHCICLRAENDIMTVLLANYLQMIAARITYEGFVGSGLKNIDRQYFCNIKMPIITNQQQVAHSLILVDKCIEQQVVLMNYLLTEKQALLQQLFI